MEPCPGSFNNVAANFSSADIEAGKLPTEEEKKRTETQNKTTGVFQAITTPTQVQKATSVQQGSISKEAMQAIGAGVCVLVVLGFIGTGMYIAWTI